MLEGGYVTVPITKKNCEANDKYAYCNVGSHAVAKGGRSATTKLKVCSDRCNAFMTVGFAQPPCARSASQFSPT